MANFSTDADLQFYQPDILEFGIASFTSPNDYHEQAREDIERDLKEIRMQKDSLDSLNNNPSTYFRNLPYHKLQKHIIIETGKYQKLVLKFNQKVESLKIK